MSAAIDVLLPAFNAAAYLRASLESLRAQTFSDFRVLVLDDGSTDESIAIAREIAAQDTRFEIVVLSHRGLVETLNHGLSLVSAPFIARQDADDISYPDRLGLQLRHMRDNPELVAISGRFLEMDAGGAVEPPDDWMPDPTAIDPFAVPAKEPILPHPFLMASTDAMRKIGGYRHVRHAEDVDLYWRLSLCGRLANLPDRLGLYRMHPNSVSAKSFHNVIVQSFFSQLAAISFRRVAAGKPDLQINAGMAEEIDRLPTIDRMVERIAGLDAVEKTYLRCAAYVKAVDTARLRKVPIDGDFLRAAIQVYRTEAPSDVRRRLLSRIWRGIRMSTRHSGIAGLSLLILLARAHFMPSRTDDR